MKFGSSKETRCFFRIFPKAPDRKALPVAHPSIFDIAMYIALERPLLYPTQRGDAAFSKRVTDMGQEPQPSSPADLHAHMRAENERWSKVIKMAGLKQLER